jgi:hypothetical protein
MLHVVGGGAVDGNPARLHGLGNLANQLDPKQSVIERGVLDLDVVRKVELPFETAGRNSPVEEFPLGFFGFTALDRDDVVLGGDRNIVRRETRDRQRNLVMVFG